MCRHGQDIYKCFILPLTYDIEVIWQENSKSVSQIDSTCIIHFFRAVSEIWQVALILHDQNCNSYI
jgi:hypothetical protein